MDIEKTQQLLVQTEATAQEIFITKDELVALDFRRQKTREAFRALKNDMVPGEKAWMSVGNIFVKTRALKAQNLLEREMKEIDKDISDLHNKLKELVRKLRDLEGKPELKGFDLQPIKKEAEIIMQVLSK